MSLPEFPNKGQTPDREEAINQIISSIAMEELGLSHVINAEGEKIQYALGTIPDQALLEEPATIDDLIKLNESVRNTLDSTMQNQMFLKAKLQSALSASVMQGPPGPPGEQGAQGEQGEQGEQGPQGTGTLIKGSSPSLEDLQKNHPDGPPEDAYIIDGELYIWSEEDGWHKAGSLKGPQGDKGEQGTQGTQGEKGEQGEQGEQGSKGIGTLIKGTAPSLEYLQQEHPDGPPEDAYLIDGVLYIWTEEEGWHSVGSLRGPEASSYTIIPFASTEAPYTYAINGRPSRVSLLGFGYGDRRNYGLIGWADYSITVDPNNFSFYLDRAHGNQDKQVVFSLPFNMILKSIYITVGTSEQRLFDNRVFPYIQLFKADAGTNNFTMIPGATAVPTVGIGPGSVVADTMRQAFIEDINEPLKAGTRIAIGAMMRTDGTSAEETYWLYFTGGIGMVYDPNP